MPPQTYNTDTQVPDSAGTATALFSGVKTRAGMVSLPLLVHLYTFDTPLGGPGQHRGL